MGMWQGKHVLVLGLGESGLALARWLAREGASVRVADSRANPPGAEALCAALPGVSLTAGAFDLDLLVGVDVLAISPGLDPRQPVIAAARERGIPVTGEIQVFVDALTALGERDRCRLIAITGTNGKTTTTALTAALCRAAGADAVEAGNISPATLAVLLDRLNAGQPLPDCWVLELSSFQLETVSELRADAAVVLNISDDHLDRYDSLADYAATKARIFAGARVAVANRDDARVASMLGDAASATFGLDKPHRVTDYGIRDGHLVRGDESLIAIDALPLAGLHNAANALAALALCEAIGLSTERLLEGLRSFRGLPHRVERIGERDDGVTYYDDSKGTNVGATIAALAGLQRSVLLIAGGDGKGQDFSPLREPVTRHARAVILIGRDGPQIAAALDGTHVPIEFAADLPRAVLRADALAQPGDAVLLSPACASFDMFRSYVHRADVFVEAVRALPRVAAA
ncbi:UDP-N-acetylmuramoyl-L-alanine--D-glutamate ligase [Denitromonas ohlonensis]|uniref:UDP-N-acetylmuramoylalanine--D-glutamate ligase n=2 Tax=Denitromonas TaxID=139331 RepID=A0A557SF72_9RHOO|nr:UDP-N-acetylmuramoyl-L-alanine--D-glutamate ligase [Denitromonas ohlonensis]TVO64174.1 UDP-N-acetylmuramoyl-L-alanine--D-glutamate ligase [Denitromonas ohlonensis]TVO76075.1 UDP-N-acetylmuramoyl-L-alanine--D-glutamate ligase [Denitromonas ohlonensis]TVT77463.1 MAG: UDP-N-acetylmuramoyl-L-alanine--D-glutamate ligase [Denitromonas halophila]